MKPHGRDCPLKCSLCAGATPRIVTIADGELLIDGAPAERDVDAATEQARQHYARKGGRR